MSNLVGDSYNKPCPYCGKPMGNAAGLGICGSCSLTKIRIPSDNIVGFLEGFVPLALPLIKAPMMKAYAVETHFNKAANTLIIRKRYYNGRIHDEFFFENDDDEYFPADDREEQNRFLMRLTAVIKDYYHNLSCCVLRRGTGGSDNDIGIVPETITGLDGVTEVLKRE